MGINRPDMKSSAPSRRQPRSKKGKPSSAFAKRCALSCPKPKNAALSWHRKPPGARGIPIESDFEFFFREFDGPNVVIGTTPATRNQGKPRVPSSHQHLESLAATWPDSHSRRISPRATTPPRFRHDQLCRAQTVRKTGHIKVFELSPSCR